LMLCNYVLGGLVDGFDWLISLPHLCVVSDLVVS
jgi:hypothetical protein